MLLLLLLQDCLLLHSDLTCCSKGHHTDIVAFYELAYQWGYAALMDIWVASFCSIHKCNIVFILPADAADCTAAAFCNNSYRYMVTIERAGHLSEIAVVCAADVMALLKAPLCNAALHICCCNGFWTRSSLCCKPNPFWRYCCTAAYKLCSCLRFWLQRPWPDH